MLALGKVAGAGLGVGALGLSQLGKIGLKLAPIHSKGGIAIDIGAPHPPTHYHYREDKSYYEPDVKHIEY